MTSLRSIAPPWTNWQNKHFYSLTEALTYFLSPEQVLFLHSRLIEETGGEHGVRDLNLLLSATGRPQASFDGEDLYPSIFHKTAALMDSLVRNHAFVDGNKRTAITSAGMFLRMNGYRLEVKNEEMVRFVMACAQSRLAFDEVTEWFKRWTVRENG
jgi:death on curing protein